MDKEVIGVAGATRLKDILMEMKEKLAADTTIPKFTIHSARGYGKSFTAQAQSDMLDAIRYNLKAQMEKLEVLKELGT